MRRLFVLVLTLIGLVSPAGAEPVRLRVLEWEGYVSLFLFEFEEYARERGIDVQLEFPIDADGNMKVVTQADDVFAHLRSRSVDVVTPSHTYLQSESGRLLNLLLPLDPSRLPNAKGLSPVVRELPVLRDAEGRTMALPLLGGSYALAYNADRVPPPDSWRVLLDPGMEAQFAVTGQQFEANVYQMALLAGVAPEDIYDIDRYRKVDRDATELLLTRLVANSAPFWAGLPYPEQMSHLSYVTDYGFGVAVANKSGQRWRIAMPKEGVTSWIDTLAIGRHVANDPKKLEAAYLLLDFLVGKRAQAHLHQTYGITIFNIEARRELGLEMDDLAVFETNTLWRPISLRTRNAFRLMWERALLASNRSVQDWPTR